MIKFFRHIRKSMIKENKATKYLLYAIGEIVLVVIGILIALQINNWNENRLKNATVKTYLSNLIQDLKVDKENLNIMFKFHSFKFYSMQYLLNLEGTNPYDPIADRKNVLPPFKPNSTWDAEIPKSYNKDFIQLAYSLTHGDFVIDITKTTVDELKSTGMYSSIDSALKKDVTAYYDYWGNKINGKIKPLSLDWQASLAEDGFITTDTYKLPDPISLLKNNPKRIGLLKRMIRESGWTLQTVISLKTLNEELIKQLEKEIAALKHI